MAIRTVLVDDSRTFRAGLAAVLSQSGGFELVGVAEDGEQAVKLVKSTRPDLVVMDVLMPGLDGVSATARIMQECPCPVVVMSSLVDASEQRVVFDAIGAGAVEVVAKPRHADKRSRQELVALLRTIGESGLQQSSGAREPSSAVPPIPPSVIPSQVRLVLIGASTGGPQAIVDVLHRLPASFPASVVLAQHLAPGFAEGMCRWLRDCTPLSVVLADRAGPLMPGTVYVAPDAHHLLLDLKGLHPVSAAGESVAPSANRLFESALPHSRGVVGILLTGMGDDGARGLSLLHQKGCHTIAQDQASSLIYGMPEAALRLMGVSEQLSPRQISRRLLELCGLSQGAAEGAS